MGGCCGRRTDAIAASAAGPLTFQSADELAIIEKTEEIDLLGTQDSGVLIPAGAIGPNGRIQIVYALELEVVGERDNPNLRLRVRLGSEAQNIDQFTMTPFALGAGVYTLRLAADIAVRDQSDEHVQVAAWSGVWGRAGGGFENPARFTGAGSMVFGVDTTVDLALRVTAQWNVATQDILLFRPYCYAFVWRE